MMFEVTDAVFACEAPVNDDHALDAGVMDQFGTHHARFPGDDEPGALGRNTVGGRVADEVHLGVMATDFHPRAADNTFFVAQTHFASAQPSTAPWAAVVSVHQDHVPFRVHEQGTELAAWAV